MKKIFVRLLDDEGVDVHQCGAGRQAQLVLARGYALEVERGGCAAVGRRGDWLDKERMPEVVHGCTLFKKVIFVTTYRSMFDGGPYIAEQIPL